MHTLGIVAQKGGVGKTTLAVHLAVAAQHDGKNVVVFDLDPQGSAYQWGKDRARWETAKGKWCEGELSVRRAYPDDLRESVDAARAEGAHLVILDTPPHAESPALRAIELADVLLVPVRPGYFDLHAAKATIRAIDDLKARASFVINQVPHNNLRIADDVAAFMESKGLKRAPGVITTLQPYVRALKDGLTAPELVPDGRHAQEIGSLWRYVQEEGARAGGRPIEAALQHALADTPLIADSIGDPLADLIAMLRENAA